MCSSCTDALNNEEVSNLVRKLKRGTGRYKGKIAFKCFNFGKIGHFASKCPYAKRSYSNEESENKYKKRNKKFVKRKSLYSKEDNSSSDEEDDSYNDLVKVLFMVLAPFLV